MIPLPLALAIITPGLVFIFIMWCWICDTRPIRQRTPPHVTLDELLDDDTGGIEYVWRNDLGMFVQKPLTGYLEHIQLTLAQEPNNR